MKPSAIVTGGGRGLGRALACELVAAGYQVGLISRNQDDLQKTCHELQECGGSAHYRIADVTDRDGLAAAVSQLVESFGGKLDLLVVNAARINWVKDETFPTEVIAGIFQTNVTGAIYSVSAVAQTMMAQRSGHIVAISSLGSLISDTGSGLKYYYASKASLNALFAAFKRHFRRHGIAINTIYPGWIDTDMFDSSRADASDQDVATAKEAAATIMLAIAEKRDVVFPRRSYRAIRYQQLLLPLRRKAKKLLAPLRGH